MRKFADVDELRAAVGEDLGTSDWVLVDPERINVFADATDDHQWIHVDPERARRESPFGGPIAHGYLTLSLVTPLVGRIIDATGFRMGVNYGAEKIRFPSPVPVGSRVRGSATLDQATPFEGGVQLNLKVTIEVEGQEKPAMVGSILFRRYV
jgi:acyl dehydratase